MAESKDTGAKPGEKAKVEVEGTVAGKPADTKPTPTTLADEGKASDNPEPGPSEGTDTKDETAKNFVASGADAHDYVKADDNVKSGDALRAEAREVDRDMGRENIANFAEGNSNHNTTAGVNPVAVAQADRPDYNPQRRPSSRANMQSTIGESPSKMADRVEGKKTAPTNAEIVGERRDQAQEARSGVLPGYTSPFMGEN